jgi:hypothetical protein
MTWSDFDTGTALERDVLQRALPTMPLSGQTSVRATYDPKSMGNVIQIGVGDTLGPTAEGCVERLALRPLLVGTAWKVLDALLEEALAQAGVTPDRGTQYTIALKEQRARSGAARPAHFSASIWQPLMSTFAETVELRHSLVHRTVHTDTTGALVGVDRAGQPLRPLSGVEQEAFGRAVMIAADLAVSSSVDSRDEARLLRHLADLGAVHRQQVSAQSVPAVIPEITMIVDPDPSHGGRYALDFPAVRLWMPFQDAHDCADIVIAPRDRPGQELRGRLEDAPSEVVVIDVDVPPAWLR